MKNKLIAVAIGMLVGLAASAQSNVQTFIRGDIGITYNTQQGDKVAPGVKDVYTLNINVDNSVLFNGEVDDTPQIIDGWVNKAVVQPRSLKYNLECNVVNPKNPLQTKNIGTMHGKVPISSDGVYHYDSQNDPLVMDILPMGNVAGFTSRFKGMAYGHPLSRPANWMDTLNQIPINISRQVNGKTLTVRLAKYDKMNFQQCQIAQGPVQFYQPVTVNGDMVYDYVKKCWFFNNFTVQYVDNGTVKSDRVAGTIRWVPDAHRASTGLGQYEFDLRVNEPIADNSAAFNSTPVDESSFFDSVNTATGLTGVMKYKDTFKPGTVDQTGDPKGDNATTLASTVSIDLQGNNITKQQIMVLGKIIVFLSIIPMNSN